MLTKPPSDREEEESKKRKDSERKIPADEPEKKPAVPGKPRRRAAGDLREESLKKWRWELYDAE